MKTIKLCLLTQLVFCKRSLSPWYTRELSLTTASALLMATSKHRKDLNLKYRTKLSLSQTLLKWDSRRKLEGNYTSARLMLTVRARKWEGGLVLSIYALSRPSKSLVELTLGRFRSTSGQEQVSKFNHTLRSTSLKFRLLAMVKFLTLKS